MNTFNDFSDTSTKWAENSSLYHAFYVIIQWGAPFLTIFQCLFLGNIGWNIFRPENVILKVRILAAEHRGQTPAHMNQRSIRRHGWRETRKFWTFKTFAWSRRLFIYWMSINIDIHIYFWFFSIITEISNWF